MTKRTAITKKEFEAHKRKIARARGLASVPRTSEFLSSLSLRQRRALKTRPMRSASGICAIAIMTKPAPCPGKCSYCPNFPNAPKSYTGDEPAALRAKQNNFDAGRQVTARVTQLEAIGHEPSKCELIVMGGTFASLAPSYQKNFVKSAFDAFNEKPSSSLAAAQKFNEKANYRVTGLVFETRPDYCGATQVRRFIEFGGTRIEIGVQSLDEAVLKKVRRGHGLAEVADATKNCKDAFLKITFHVMPGLYSTPEGDAAQFRALFSDERFKPDGLKIYPCLVIPNTPLYDEWKKGEFTPYDTATATRAIALCKRFVPRYCRIMRVDRDIPVRRIAAGVDKSNLRELAQKELQAMGGACECIRCREAGFREIRGTKVSFDEAQLNRLDYRASGGREVFLSFDDTNSDSLLAFLRLRFNEDGDGRCGVRELRVCGEQIPVGQRKTGALQHEKLGAKLLAQAEEIAASEFAAKRLFVLSGVGARPYYRKRGYALRDYYMVKKL
ncbi:MAG: tRNA uridine(34) 5-carboxymethylaminomethyl modification radical SAM/GNAT enzyme Elp3 [Candidatus Micrarchaeota archaeon]